MYADDRLKVLQELVKNLSKTLKQEKLVMDNLKSMIDTVEFVVQSSKDKSLTLEKAEEIFSSLKVSLLKIYQDIMRYCCLC